jgi:O-antigen ligase
MSSVPEPLSTLAPARRFSPGAPAVWVSAVVGAVGISFLVAYAGRIAGFPEYDYAVGAAAVLGAAAAAYLVVGPSHLTVAVFLGYMILSHQFRSPFILALANVEWHPREVILFVLAAHLGFKVLVREADLRPDMIHYFFYVYMFFFALIAVRGALRQPEVQQVIGECRYPLFLVSYFALVACVHDRADLGFQLRWVFAVTMLVALASLAFFAYTTVTGNIINVQNYLGEYVPRLVGPFRLQSVRANGHMFFEVAVVVLTSLMLCREVRWWSKILYAGFIAVLLGAIAITMMRTAYVSLTVSLLALGLLFLPRELQALAWFFGLVILGAIFVAVGLEVHTVLLDLVPEDLGISLMGRFVEIEGAWEAFLREPLLGAGMGSTFEGMGYVAKTTQYSFAQVEYQTVHNVWIYYLFKGGLVGMALILLGLGGIVWRGYWIADRITEARERFLMRGLLAAFIGQLVASLAMPRLTYPIGGVFLAMMAAAFAVMARSVADGPAAARR